MGNLKSYLHSVWDLLVIFALIIVAIIIAVIQWEIGYIVLILDAIFVWMILNMDRKFYNAGQRRTISSRAAAVVFIVLIPATVVAPWNIALFAFVMLPLISFGVFRRRRKGRDRAE